jgi:RNA polymerase sigma-54 factor
MVLELKQSAKLVQQLVITPQLQQAIRLLQLTRLELVDMISQEMKENPLLEEAEEGKELAESEAPVAGLEETDTSPEPEHTPEVKGNGEGADEFDWENYLENSNLIPFQKSSRMRKKDPPLKIFSLREPLSQIIFGGNSTFTFYRRRA